MLLFLFLFEAAFAAEEQAFQLGPSKPYYVSIPKRFNYFDLELLQTSNDETNYFISPASIKATLGMLLEGSSGGSAQEIANLLRILPINQLRTKEILQSLLYELNDKSGTTIMISANAVFVSEKFSVSPSYRETLRNVYNALVKPLDFENVEESAVNINKWVSDVTMGLIPALVAEYSLSPDTSLIVANALYFKGKWKEAFSSKNTYQSKCFKSKNVCYPVSMMHLVGTFRYKFIDQLDATALGLPYNDGTYAMLLLLPSQKSNVNTLIRDLQHVSFSDILENLEPVEVLVEIPRFEIEYTADMVPALRTLGIREIFSNGANLSSILEGRNVRVDSILHKTKIEVNEEGTVAVAATGAVVVPLMGSVMQEFVADRPFLFFIYNALTNNIIFEGRYNKPHQVPYIYENPNPVQPLQPVKQVAQSRSYFNPFNRNAARKGATNSF